jgi:lipoprotein-anchoring transpeptidase ErfK/SrfK
MSPSRTSPRAFRVCILLMLTLWLGACAKEKDLTHVVRISVPQQRLAVYDLGHEVARYTISTSKFGVGDIPGSNCTPLGALEVAQKIGAGAPIGMKFKSRCPTGEIVKVNAPGRDPVVTRILWLRGLEPQNANAFNRMIYIHGTPEECRLGTPSSFGCIRMRSKDVVALYDQLGKGARVEILTTALPKTRLPKGSEDGTANTANVTAQARFTSESHN